MPLGDVAEIIMGQSPPSSTYNTEGDGLPFYQGKIEFGERYPSPRKWCSGPKKTARKNDVLISVRAPVGPTNIADDECCIGRGLAAIRPKRGVDHVYLWYHLQHLEPTIAKMGVDSTFKAIDRTAIRRIGVRVPSLEIQKRIAAVLEKADRARRRQLSIPDDLRTLLRARFESVFGFSNKRRKTWKRRKLGDVVEIDAPMVDPRQEEYSDLLHVGGDNIESRTGKILECRTAAEDRMISGKFLFDERYILYSKIRPKLRKVALPDFRGLCSADIYPIRPKEGLGTREFLLGLLGTEEFSRFAEGAGERRTSIPKINRDELVAFECAWPPEDLQEEYAAFVRGVMAAEKKAAQLADSGKSLFRSLLHRAFRGDLVSNEATA